MFHLCRNQVVGFLLAKCLKNTYGRVTCLSVSGTLVENGLIQFLSNLSKLISNQVTAIYLIDVTSLVFLQQNSKTPKN